MSGLGHLLADSLSRVTDQAVSSDARTVRVGLLGCGNVGGALVPLLRAQRDAIAARTGLNLVVTSVAVRNMSRDRGVELGDVSLTNDAMAVVSDPEIDVVVEVIGGIEPARELIVAALSSGKPVVTGIPLIRPLRESLRGEPVSRVMGILNGTTNYILSKMTNEGADYADALAEAQRLGYAERDPTADVEGFDAGAKAAIIASIAFGVKVVAGDVYHEGISNITASDIAIAGRLGYVVKLLGIAEQDRDTGEVAVRVHPAMVPNEHPLASVRDSYNAVFVEGDAVGSLMFFGRGAGGDPTASAVLGDLIDAAVNRDQGTHGSLGAFQRARVRQIDATSAEYLLALDVLDQPGVLHSVTGVFAEHGVSIRAAEQEGAGEEARLVFITHEAVESSVQATVRQLRELDVVRRIGGLIRVIGE